MLAIPVVMTVDEIAAAVEHHLRVAAWDRLPVSALGDRECRLFIRQMPWAWFWGSKHLLPVVVAAGAAQLGITIPLQPDKVSPFGYTLPDGVPFLSAMVDQALEIATIEEHRINNPLRSDHGRLGHHLNFTPLVRAFYAVVEAQGLEHCPALFNVLDMLEESFFYRTRLAPDRAISQCAGEPPLNTP